MLTDDELDEIVASAKRHAAAGDREAAWRSAQPLMLTLRDESAAGVLVSLVAKSALPFERRLEVLKRVFEHHAQVPGAVAAMGDAYEAAHDVGLLNAAPPPDPFPAVLAARLKELFDVAHDHSELELAIASGLGTVARLLGRAWDGPAEAAMKRQCECSPEAWGPVYGLGLFYKTRGRFAEGLAANQRAAKLGGADDEAVRWNSAICATGCGEGELALQLQRKMGLKLELGRHGLPEGRFDEVKVRVAERPLAERGPENDDPGVEENIWVQRLSACHGVVRSVLVEPGSVDYGDTVLFDGAPITHHTVEGRGEVPLFPHLATLDRGGYRLWDFAGTQSTPEQIAKLSLQLPEDAVLYVHSEQVQLLCKHCSDGDPRHPHREENHHVVRGRLAAPPSCTPAAVLAAVDAAVANEKGVRLFVPELCSAAGDAHRADVEQRRIKLIEGSGG